MKAAYNQNDLGLYPLDENYEDPCDNCLFIRPGEYTCILADFDEGSVDELFRCWNSIFIPEPLSNIFEL